MRLAFARLSFATAALRNYAPEGRRTEMDTRVSRAVAFLRGAQPQDTQEFAFRLLGLMWGGAAADEVAAARQALADLQRTDGGWAQLPSMDPDAYATGQALYALHAARMPASDRSIRRAPTGCAARSSTMVPGSSARAPSASSRTRNRIPASPQPVHFDGGDGMGIDRADVYARKTEPAVIRTLNAQLSLDFDESLQFLDPVEHEGVVVPAANAELNAFCRHTRDEAAVARNVVLALILG